MKKRVIKLVLCMMLLSIPLVGCEKKESIAKENVTEQTAEEMNVLPESSENAEDEVQEAIAKEESTVSEEEEQAEGPIGEATEVIYTMDEDDFAVFADSEGDIYTSKTAMWLYQNLDYNKPHILIVKENRDVIEVKEGESYRLEGTDLVRVWPTCKTHIPDSIRRPDEILDEESGSVCYPQLTEINVPGDTIDEYYEGFRNGDYSRYGADSYTLAPDYSLFESPQKISVSSFTTSGEQELVTTTVYLYAPTAE